MPSRNNYLLLIEYDGTEFSGWAKQPGARTVQGEAEAALSKLGFKAVNSVAAGRTDKGVHATGQVLSVSFSRCLGAVADLGYALNSVLHKDISVISAEKIHGSFNPRFEARTKTYRYEIWNRPLRSVWRGKHAWHIPKPLNAASMKKAAAHLEGRHDFSAFDASGSNQANKTADLKKIKITFRDGAVTFRVTGDRFLYKMVRNIVGTLVEAGLGKMSPGRVKSILENGDRRNAGPTAPAKGLFLEQVVFNEKQKRKTKTKNAG